MSDKITYDLIDGEPVACSDCYYHHNERCTLISNGTYLTPCIPSSHSTCVPGLRVQRDNFKEKLAGMNREYREEFERGQHVQSPTIYWEVLRAPARSNNKLVQNKVTARPKHSAGPEITISGPVISFGVNMPSLTVFGAHVECEATIDGERGVIFAVDVPWREEMPDCSVCCGAGVNPAGEVCTWCNGEGSSPLDEAKEIAAALYWSWIRSPGERGGLEREDEDAQS